MCVVSCLQHNSLVSETMAHQLFPFSRNAGGETVAWQDSFAAEFLVEA